MKNIDNLIEKYMERNSLYNWVISDLVADWEEYDIDMRVALERKLKELEHGCASGIVSSLIYCKDTSDFFEEHYSDIEEYNDDEGETVEDTTFNKYINTHNKCITAWFIYEYICNEFRDSLEEI